MADVDAVNLLKSKLTVHGCGVDLIVGERGDDVVLSVDSEIPALHQGYYLKVEPGKVTIAGNDNEGTYYGVQSFLQLMSALDRIKRSDRKELKTSEFIFEIIPVGNKTLSYMNIKPDETCHIRSGNDYLTNF